MGYSLKKRFGYGGFQIIRSGSIGGFAGFLIFLLVIVVSSLFIMIFPFFRAVGFIFFPLIILCAFLSGLFSSHSLSRSIRSPSLFNHLTAAIVSAVFFFIRSCSLCLSVYVFFLCIIPYFHIFLRIYFDSQFLGRTDRWNSFKEKKEGINSLKKNCLFIWLSPLDKLRCFVCEVLCFCLLFCFCFRVVLRSGWILRSLVVAVVDLRLFWVLMSQ